MPPLAPLPVTLMSAVALPPDVFESDVLLSAILTLRFTLEFDVLLLAANRDVAMPSATPDCSPTSNVSSSVLASTGDDSSSTKPA